MLLRETYPFAVRLEELFTAAGSEVRGDAEDILVCSKEALVWSDTDSNDGARSQVASDINPKSATSRLVIQCKRKK